MDRVEKVLKQAEELERNRLAAVNGMNDATKIEVLTQALQYMILDLEENGEVLGTDEKRINFMQEAIDDVKEVTDGQG